MHNSVSEVLEMGRQAVLATGEVPPYFEVYSEDGEGRPFVFPGLPETHRERYALMFLFGHAVVVGGTEDADGVMLPGMLPESMIALTDAWFRMPTVAEAEAEDGWQVAGHPDARECILVSRSTVDGPAELIIQPYTRHANGIVFDEPIDWTEVAGAEGASSPLLENFWMGAACGLVVRDGSDSERMIARRIVQLARIALGADVAFRSMDDWK